MTQFAARIRLSTGLDLPASLAAFDLYGERPFLELKPDEAPASPPRDGDEATVVFPGTDELEVHGRVVCASSTAAELYRVALLTRDAAEVARILNRRDALRVTPALTAPVRAKVLAAPEHEGFDVAVANLSLAGMSCVVEPKLADGLARGVELQLLLAFPGDKSEHEVWAEVRHRLDEKTETQIGLGFSVGAEGGEFRRALSTYVLRRQRELG